MAKNVINVKLKLDDSDFSRGLQTNSEKLMGFGKKAAIGVGAAAGAATAAYYAVKPLVDASSSLREEQAKAAVVFGDSADKIAAWAENADETAAMSKRAATQFASQFGQFGKSAGLTGDQLADFSLAMSQLTADYSSFNDVSIEEAATKLLSGLAGEAEPLRRWGKDVSAATVTAKALELGLADTAKELTNQDKVLARYQIIMSQSSDEMGDMARNSEGLAVQQRILQAKFENVKAELGQKLLPVMVKVVSWLNDDFLPAAEKFAGWLEVNVPKAVDAAKPFFDIVVNSFETIGAAIGLIVDVFQGDWSGAWDNMKQVFGGFVDDIRMKVELFKDLGVDLLKFLWEGVLSWIPTLARNFGRMPAKIVGYLGDAGEWLYDAGKDVVRGLWDGIKSMAGWLEDKISGWAGDVIGWVKSGFGILSPSRVFAELGEQLPAGLAMGIDANVGVSEASIGGMVDSAVVAARPSVGGSSGGGVVINVTAGVGDPVAIGAQIDRIMQQYTRTAGPARFSVA